MDKREDISESDLIAILEILPYPVSMDVKCSSVDLSSIDSGLKKGHKIGNACFFETQISRPDRDMVITAYRNKIGWVLNGNNGPKLKSVNWYPPNGSISITPDEVRISYRGEKLAYDGGFDLVKRMREVAPNVCYLIAINQSLPKDRD